MLADDLSKARPLPWPKKFNKFSLRHNNSVGTNCRPAKESHQLGVFCRVDARGLAPLPFTPPSR